MASYKLVSSFNWDSWELDYYDNAINLGLWENLRPIAGVPWLQEPTADAGLCTWYRYLRQREDRLVLRRWMVESVSDRLATMLKRLYTDDPLIMFDFLKETIFTEHWEQQQEQQLAEQQLQQEQLEQQLQQDQQRQQQWQQQLMNFSNFRLF